MDINSLPLETFVEILKRTDGPSLGTCRRVCKKWQETIDGTDLLWQEFCHIDFKYPSSIAKNKTGNECKWYHIYKNLKMWSNICTTEMTVREFYKFQQHDKCHALGIDYSVLPLKDARGVVLYDMSTLKYIPVALPEKNCLKISNNELVTVILLKTGLLLQRSVDNIAYRTEAFFKADNFVLSKEVLYFFNNRDVFKCDLTLENLTSKLILHCDYDIKELEFYNGIIYLFTDCGKIVSIVKESNVSVKPINIPIEWIKQIKHINAIDDKNFVCYSRNLFKIETDKYQHLYLDFPPVTALFFYGDIVLIGSKTGEILLYRLSSQKRAIKPIFEKLAVLPDGKFAVQLDVVERRTGPVIVVATFFEIMLVEVNCFPHEQQSKRTFSPDKLQMYKRLLKIRDRLSIPIRASGMFAEHRTDGFAAIIRKKNPVPDSQNKRQSQQYPGDPSGQVHITAVEVPCAENDYGNQHFSVVILGTRNLTIYQENCAGTKMEINKDCSYSASKPRFLCRVYSIYTRSRNGRRRWSKLDVFHGRIYRDVNSKTTQFPPV